MNYKKVDINSLFVSSDNTAITLSKNEVGTIVNYIKTKNGGKGKKNVSYHLHKPDVKAKSVRCKFDVVVIEGHGCALLNLLGEGAFGKVYKAVDLTNGKLVAVKCQPSYLAEIILKQTKNTKENGIGLTDPLANYGPSFLGDGYGYFILPLADCAFYRWISIQRTRPKGDENILEALIKISMDLEDLHGKKKVHMDLKSDNVLIVNDRAYLSDFGKVENEGDMIPVVEADYKQYPQCAPEYFRNINNNSHYRVSSTFDLFSFGYLIETTLNYITKTETKKELRNISVSLCSFDPSLRINLQRARSYLRALRKE